MKKFNLQLFGTSNKKTTNSTYKSGTVNGTSYSPGTATAGTYTSGYNASTYTAPEFSYSDATNNYLSNLNSSLSNMANYNNNSQYGTLKSNVLDKITNGEKFNYDFNTDALYQQYKDNYTKLGNEAAMNAAASASALTGGYGSSYATTAAAQANQQYMTQLNNVIPELAEAALEKYQMEREDLYNQYNALSTEDNTQYSRISDLTNLYANLYGTSSSNDLSKYNATTDAYFNAVNATENSKQYAEDSRLNAWNATENALSNAASYNQNETGSKLSAAQAAAELEEEKRQANLNYALSLLSKNNSGSGTSSGTAGTGAKTSISSDDTIIKKPTTGSNLKVVQGTDANGKVVNYIYDTKGNLLNDPNKNLHN